MDDDDTVDEAEEEEEVDDECAEVEGVTNVNFCGDLYSCGVDSGMTGTPPSSVNGVSVDGDMRS